MKDRNPFEHTRASAGGSSLTCDEWEILLAESIDGLLAAEKRAAFDAHSSECQVCGALLNHARQGREWLHFLEQEPEVPAGMVDRILSKTSGSATAPGPLAIAGGAHSHIPVQLLGMPLRRSMWDTRMLMTAAMAFFSIALTLNVALNLAGVRLTNLKLADLTPANMEMNLSQQFYGAKKSLVQYYDNLRLVYEVESKMRDLRRNEQMQQSAPQQLQAAPANPRSSKDGSKMEPSAKVSGGTLWGSQQLAGATTTELGNENPEYESELKEVEVKNIASHCDSVQAERSLA